MKSWLLAILLVTPLVTPLVDAADPKSPDWQELIAAAKRHGMPFPPRDAELALVHTETWSVLGNRSNARDPAIYAPGFILETRKDGSITTLSGTTAYVLENRKEPLSRPFTTEKQEPKPGGYLTRFGTDAFVCAIQCAERDDLAHAGAIWKRHHAHRLDPHGLGIEDNREPEPDEMAVLAEVLFGYYWAQLRQSDADFGQILRRFEALIAEFPDLKNPASEKLVNNLRRSVESEPPEQGSVEDLLLTWSRLPSRYRHLGLFDSHADETDTAARKIVLMGYDAIPDLIELADDPRLTAHYQSGFMRAKPRLKSLGELAAELVSEIAGAVLVPPGFSSRCDSEQLRKWWSTVDPAKERELLEKGLFNREEQKIRSCNEVTARIIAHKYPDALAGLCAEFTEHAAPDGQPYALAEAIATADLPLEQRIRMLVDFAKSGSLEHKRCVLQNLAQIDEKACAPLLIPILRALPPDHDGPYWQSPIPSYSHVVMQVGHDPVWSEFLRCARRSAVGQRMEMMNSFNYAYIGDKNSLRRLAFLAAFLEDRQLRDDSKDKEKWEGPCAAFTFPKIEVRNFAAMKIASILDFPVHPDEFWTKMQWLDLRTNVRAALAKLELPVLDAEE